MIIPNLRILPDGTDEEHLPNETTRNRLSSSCMAHLGAAFYFSCKGAQKLGECSSAPFGQS